MLFLLSQSLPTTHATLIDSSPLRCPPLQQIGQKLHTCTWMWFHHFISVGNQTFFLEEILKNCEIATQNVNGSVWRSSSATVLKEGGEWLIMKHSCGVNVEFLWAVVSSSLDQQDEILWAGDAFSCPFGEGVLNLCAHQPDGPCWLHVHLLHIRSSYAKKRKNCFCLFLSYKIRKRRENKEKKNSKYFSSRKELKAWKQVINHRLLWKLRR